MAQTIPDCWPDSFQAVADPLTPTSILKMQAAKLGEKTGGIILGEVQARVLGETIRSDFNLIVPALSNYRYRLLSITHGFEQYPVEIHGIPGREVLLSGNNEGEFLDALRQILQSESTRRVIESLIEHSQ